MSLVELLPFALLGGLLGLDVVSFPQVMVSRPIVAATLAGAVAGDPLAGLTIGAFLELVALGTLPFGASRYPEWGSASVAGGVLCAAMRADGGASDGALVLAALVALVAAWAGGLSMVWLRRLNARWARVRLAQLQQGSGGAIVRLQFMGLAADFARGTLLTGLVLLVALSPLRQAIAAWDAHPVVTATLIAVVGGSVATAAVWRLFHTLPKGPWLFTGGLVLGLLAVLLA